MGNENKELLAFNRGVISPRGLARIDLERMAMSAETQTNWMPRVLGSMMLRPGLEFINVTFGSGFVDCFLESFIFSQNDTAVIVGDESSLHILIDDTYLATDGIVNSQVVNNTFDTDIASWTDASEAGGTAYWVTGGYAGLQGDGTDYAILRQTVTAADIGKTYHVFVGVEDGPVRFKIGSVAGEDDFFSTRILQRGGHWLGFVPDADFTIEIANDQKHTARVDQVSLQGLGGIGDFISLAHDVLEEDFGKVRMTQSNDVIYWTTAGYKSYKLLRDDNNSWSIESWLPEDGPFRTQNVSGVTIETDMISGDAELTSSQSLFRQEHADNRALFRLASFGQTVSDDLGGAPEQTESIRVVGTADAREFGIIIEGTFNATVSLQFAFTEDGPWNDQGDTWTVPVSTTYKDGQDGQIIYYRLAIKSGDYVSGTATCTLTYTGGSIQGIGRVYNFTDSTHVDVHVLKDFGSIEPTKDWWEGEWSDRRNWPTAVDINEGRLMLAGDDKIHGSISDSFDSFDDNFEGDGGAINRSIARGPNRIVHWLLGLSRLMLGSADNAANVAPAKIEGNSPLSVRSNNFDEPLTPTNFNIKAVDSKGVFVDRTEQRLYELAYDANSYDYKPLDLSVFTPDFNVSGIRRIAVQMKPDVRVHCVRNDGTVGLLVFDRLENVICWVDVVTDAGAGEVLDVTVIPGVEEDQVYYAVRRFINTVYTNEVVKWAKESECIGGLLNKQADSFSVYDDVPTVTPFPSGLLYLRGETVIIWADGIDVGTDVVDIFGALTNDLAVAASKVVVGLPYTAQFKSAKLAELTGIGLLERKKVNRLGFIAENMHYQGLQYGPDFDNLSDLPKVSRGQAVSDNQIYSEYHEDNFPFGGTWNEDARICLQAAAPRPCTIKAAILEMESVEHKNPRRAPRRS